VVVGGPTLPLSRQGAKRPARARLDRAERRAEAKGKAAKRSGPRPRGTLPTREAISRVPFRVKNPHRGAAACGAASAVAARKRKQDDLADAPSAARDRFRIAWALNASLSFKVSLVGSHHSVNTPGRNKARKERGFSWSGLFRGFEVGRHRDSPASLGPRLPPSEPRPRMQR